MNTNPPVSGYDEAPAEGEGEKADRMAYAKTLREATGDNWQPMPKDYEASPCVLDPDNYWVDDETGERIYALNGERTPAVVYGVLLGAKIVELQASNERLETMRHAVYHSDCEIKINDNRPTFDDAITLWKIRGVPRTLYPTKMAAEVAARAHFPHDNPTVRYSRITFIEIDYDFNFGEEV